MSKSKRPKTKQERESLYPSITEGLLKGYTLDEIAEQLDLNRNTVAKYRRDIFKKNREGK